VAIANWRSAGELVQTASVRQARALRQRLLEATQRLRLIEQYELFRRPSDIVDIRRQRVDDLQKSLVTALRQRHAKSTQRLNSLMTAFARQHPRQLLRLSQQRLAALQLALPATAKRAIERQLQKLNAIQTHLTAISPQATLGRGYSITSKKNGAVVRNAADVKTGDVLLTRFADGQTESVVRDNKQMRLFE
jgi:exodeoxyribonuclease VII large subunit